MISPHPADGTGATHAPDQPALVALNASRCARIPLHTLGPVAILAPHPDDETLGCGGLLALCGRAGIALTVIAMTYGENSHPDSREISPQQLVAIRAEERRQALTALGAPSVRVERLGLPDGGMQGLSNARSQQCVAQLRGYLLRDRIRSLWVTAANEEHPDHRASYALAQRAVNRVSSIRTFTYAVWPPSDAIETGDRWSLDIRSVYARKCRAVACFASQQGGVIQDDPHGFVMTPALLDRSLKTSEQFTRI